MTEWPVKTLGEVCDFVSGSVTPKPGVKYEVFSVPSFDCGNPELLDGSEIKSSKRPVEPGDVLLCKINPRINRVWRVDRESKNQQIASTEWITLRCRGNVLDVYLQYVLQAPSARTAMIESVTGATGSHTRAKYEIVEDLEFSVPPLEEQKRIVALLDAATARVTELTACYEQARTHANNLFTSALRDELEGNPDWPLKTLGDLLEVSIGGIWGSEAGEDEVDVFVYRSTELTKDGQLKEELTVRRSITARQLDSRKLEEGDLLLEKSGGGPKSPVGRVGLVKILPGLSVCSNFMQLMRPRKKDVLPIYLHYFLNYFHVAGHTEDLQNNSTNIRNLKTTEYMDVEIPLPPLEVQKRIVARLDSIKVKSSEMVDAYDAKLTAAKNLRQSILEAAFAGQL